jgi:putative heme iron utilization protein
MQRSGCPNVQNGARDSRNRRKKQCITKALLSQHRLERVTEYADGQRAEPESDQVAEEQQQGTRRGSY